MTKRSSSSGGGGEYEVGHGKPPKSSQFKKGSSGNPSGRPPKTPLADPSPFDLVLETKLTIIRDGNRQDVTPEEALQQALLQKAFEGDSRAISKVLKMIQKRQAAIAALAPAAPPPQLLTEEPDPDNANEALLLLGIGTQDPAWDSPRLKLLPWAMQAALDRRRGPALRSDDITLLKNSVPDPEQVRWPEPGRR